MGYKIIRRNTKSKNKSIKVNKKCKSIKVNKKCKTSKSKRRGGSGKPPKIINTSQSFVTLPINDKVKLTKELNDLFNRIRSGLPRNPIYTTGNNFTIIGDANEEEFINKIMDFNLEKEYERQLKLIFRTTLCYYAASRGNLETLKWAHESGYFLWNATTCSAAAENGHLDCLKYAHENGCPWNEGACSAAAKSGDLNILIWLRSQNPPCPWDSSSCSSAGLADAEKTQTKTTIAKMLNT